MRIVLASFVVVTVLFVVGCQKHSAREFVSIEEPLIALTNVRVIDGSGVPAREKQTIIIESGRIKMIGPTSETPVPPTAKSFDLEGPTAIPGLVGMHEHLFYTTDAGARNVVANISFARLYLAAGVTTIRTGGTLSLDNDLTTKNQIENGEWPGPKIHLTSPYINHPVGESLDLQQSAQQIDEWAVRNLLGCITYLSAYHEYFPSTRARML